MDNLWLLCHVCRGTARRPWYKYSITARWKFCSRFINSRLNAQLSTNLLNEVSFVFWYFEVRVRYRRKKSSRSLSHLLMSSCHRMLNNVLERSFWRAWLLFWRSGHLDVGASLPSHLPATHPLWTNFDTVFFKRYLHTELFRQAFWPATVYSGALHFFTILTPKVQNKIVMQRPSLCRFSVKNIQK